MKIAQPLFFLLLLMFAALCSHAQRRLVEISKEYTTKEITVTDGMTYKYTIGSQNDTARYFNPNGEVLEATIVFKKPGGTVPPVFVTEKVDGEKATFSPNWSIHGITTAADWYGENNTRTIAYSNVVGSSVSYTFTGTKIELWAEKKTSHGTGTVSIDNGPAQSVSFVGPSALPVLIYSSPDLPLGSHTIRMTVVNGYNLLDYFQITKPQ